MALDFPVGTDFPANGNQIPNGHEYDGFYWDATAGVWKRLCEADDPFDPTSIECVDNDLTTSLGTLSYQSSSDTLTADGVKGNIPSGALASTLTELEFGADADETIFIVGGQLQLTNTTLDTPADVFEITVVDGYKLTVAYKSGDAATVYNTNDALEIAHTGGLQVNADCLFCEGDERSICEEINLLQNQVIELEEEIDAIAPSVEYGTWEWQNPSADNATRPPNPGTFFLAKDGPGGAIDPVVTTQYVDADVIVIHNNEYVPPGSTDPVDTHSWSDADAGKLIQLFDRADPDFFLGTILSAQVESDHVRIRVERVQTSGVPNDNADPDTGDFLTRINIFNAPSGGDASEFVKKIGDTMSGTLQMGDSSTYPGSTNTNSPKITFEAKKSNGTTYTSELYGNTSGYLYSSRNFFSNGTIQSKSTSGFGYDGSTRMGFGTKSIDGSSSTTPYAYLGIGTGSDVRAMEWSGAKGLIWLKANNTTGSKGQVLKKDRTNNRPKWQGTVDISPSGTDRCVGEIWYNANDQVLYVRVS